MQRFKLGICVFAILMLGAGTAYAAADGEHHESWLNLFLRIINLALFVGAIWFFFGKKIKGAFVGRSEGIATEIASVEERKAEAQKKLEEVEKRIANLDAERDAILENYRQQGEAMSADIVARAEKTAQAITEQAKTTVQNEVTQVIAAMREQVAEEIIAAAEKAVAKKLTPAEQAKLIDKYLTRVVLN